MLNEGFKGFTDWEDLTLTGAHRGSSTNNWKGYVAFSVTDRGREDTLCIITCLVSISKVLSGYCNENRNRLADKKLFPWRNID